MKITNIKECVRNKNRINIYADDEFLCALYLETALKNDVKIGAEFDEQVLLDIKKQDSEQYAFSAGLSYVSAKMRTEKEVCTKLKQKGLDERATADALQKLTEYGYVDDENYAVVYAQELLQKYGRRVAVQKMILRGISAEAAKEALAQFPQDDELIDTYLENLMDKYEEEEPYKKKQKIIRSLMTKGFDYDDIKSAMNRYEE
ncbi:MAG: RecX family transcriptional regulator [Christensenellaceae bacterium]